MGLATTKKILRILAFLEGISFIALIGIGMPLKYLYGIRTPNLIIGQAHGLLFLAFLGFAYAVSQEEKWSPGKQWLAFFASVLPLGTFWFDHRYLKNQD